MPPERTASQVLTREPVTIELGGTKYQVPIPLVPAAMAWRKRVFEQAGEVAETLAGKSTNGLDPQFFVGLRGVMMALPEKLIESIKAAVPTLTDEQVAQLTEEELAYAFDQIWSVYNPFQGQVSALMDILRNEAILSASARSTN